MKTIRLLVIVFCIFEFCSCGKKKTMTVRWEGGTRIQDIDWIVDKTPVGKGVEGFRRFLKRLEQQPDQSLVRVYYPAELWNRKVPGYFVMDEFPFRENDILRKEFEAVAAKKYLHFEACPEYD